MKSSGVTLRRLYAVLMTLIVCTMFLMFPSMAQAVETTPGNINGGGLAAAYSEWIYYHSADNGGKLYKMKYDGTGREEVCSDIAADINVFESWIFYTNLSDGSKIYKIRTDGTGRAKLCDDNSYNLTVADGGIYYVNLSEGGHLYKINYDGTSKTKLNDHNTRYLNVGWDWVYYVNIDDNCSIYRYKKDEPEKVYKLNGVSAWGVNVTDKWIFFSNLNDGGTLYRVNGDGSQLIKLSIDIPYDIHAAGDWIYYSDGSDSGRLCRAKVDGTGKESIYGSNTYLLNIIGDYIYFSGDSEGLSLNRIKNDGTGFSQIGRSSVKNYISLTREVKFEKAKALPGKVEWVETVKPDDSGISVKDAFNNDGRKIAFLTFDDGPSRNITPAILDILKENNIKATFFVTGSMAQSYGEMVKRAYSEGHTIANHSYSHRYSYLYGSLQNFMGEVRDCDSVLKGILGESFESGIFRFPGGAFGSSYSLYKSALEENGYQYINWNVSTGDSEYNGVPTSQLIANVRDTAYGNAHIVVLMHDLGSKYTTVQALPYIIEYLRDQGYQFKRLIR